MNITNKKEPNNNSEHSHSLEKHDKIIWLDWPALIIFIALMLIVFLQFFTRYFLNDSLGWTEEIARFLLISLVFTGSVSVVYRSEHIFLEVVHRMVHRSNSKPLALLSEIAAILYYAVLGIFAFLLMLETDQDLISIAFPKAAIYGFVAFTLFFSIALTAIRINTLIKKSSEDIYQELDAKAVDEG